MGGIEVWVLLERFGSNANLDNFLRRPENWKKKGGTSKRGVHQLARNIFRPRHPPHFAQHQGFRITSKRAAGFIACNSPSKHSIRPSCRPSRPPAPSVASQSAHSQHQPQNVLPASPSTTAPPPAAASSPSTTPAPRDPLASPPARQRAILEMSLRTL